MTARGEQSILRIKRIGLPPFFLFSRVSTGVLGSELPKFMPLRSYGEVGGFYEGWLECLGTKC